MGRARARGAGKPTRWDVKRSDDGFTLIEMMIVVTLIAIIAAIAVPNLIAARLSANESSAVATLRSISTAQAQFQMSGKCDVNDNGAGEYGLLREMSSAARVRTSPDAADMGDYMNPQVLSGSFRVSSGGGEVTRSGYIFRLALPGTNGTGVLETSVGALDAPVHSSLAETTWCCYAWPASYSRSGNRTYFVNERADIVSTDYDSYSGAGRITAANVGSAFMAGADARLITGIVAVGTRGRDGRIWKPLS